MDFKVPKTHQKTTLAIFNSHFANKSSKIAYYGAELQCAKNTPQTSQEENYSSIRKTARKNNIGKVTRFRKVEEMAFTERL